MQGMYNVIVKEKANAYVAQHLIKTMIHARASTLMSLYVHSFTRNAHANRISYEYLGRRQIPRTKFISILQVVGRASVVKSNLV